MSFDPNSPVVTDRVIQMISEGTTKKDFLYRTLFGNKALPTVVYQIEHITLLYDIVNPLRQRTLEKFYDVHRNTLISTTSIDGKTWEIMTTQKLKHVTEGASAKKSFNLFGGGGQNQ